MDPYLIIPIPLVLSPAVARDVQDGLLLDPFVYRHWQGDWGAVSAEDAHRFTAVAEASPLVRMAVRSLFHTLFGTVEIISRPELATRTSTVTLAGHVGEIWEPTLETAAILRMDPR